MGKELRPHGLTDCVTEGLQNVLQGEWHTLGNSPQLMCQFLMYIIMGLSMPK